MGNYYSGTSRIAIGDLDQDGDQDIASANSGFILWNNGQGSPYSITTVPDTIHVTRGGLASGGVFEISESDNSDLTLRRATNDLSAMTELEVTSISPIAGTPGSISINVKGAVFARSAINQTIAAYNFEDAVWETVDSRLASRFSDSIVTVELDGDLSRFIGSRRGMKLRISFESSNRRARFSSNTDHIYWEIGR